jgi:hypothetical protein
MPVLAQVAAVAVNVPTTKSVCAFADSPHVRIASNMRILFIELMLSFLCGLFLGGLIVFVIFSLRVTNVVRDALDRQLQLLLPERESRGCAGKRASADIFLD